MRIVALQFDRFFTGVGGVADVWSEAPYDTDYVGHNDFGPRLSGWHCNRTYVPISAIDQRRRIQEYQDMDEADYQIALQAYRGKMSN